MPHRRRRLCSALSILAPNASRCRSCATSLAGSVLHARTLCTSLSPGRPRRVKNHHWFRSMPKAQDRQGVDGIHPLHRAGGCVPPNPLWRSSFRSSITTVARPVGVHPMMRRQAASQIKWSAHFWRRGLKSGTMVSVSGSRPSTRSPRRSLQLRQAKAKLSASCEPPAAWGST